MTNLINCLLDCNWDSISSTQYGKNLYDKFLSILQSNLTEHVPFKHAQRITQFRHPWMTTGLLSSCSHENKLYKQYTSGKITKDSYAERMNFFSMAIKTRKRQYYTELFTMH